MDCHPIQTYWCPHLCHPTIFTLEALLTQPSQFINLSWLGIGTKCAGLHTRWLGFLLTNIFIIFMNSKFNQFNHSQLNISVLITITPLLIISIIMWGTIVVLNKKNWKSHLKNITKIFQHTVTEYFRESNKSMVSSASSLNNDDSLVDSLLAVCATGARRPFFAGYKCYIRQS